MAAEEASAAPLAALPSFRSSAAEALQHSTHRACDAGQLPLEALRLLHTRDAEEVALAARVEVLLEQLRSQQAAAQPDSGPCTADRAVSWPLARGVVARPHEKHGLGQKSGTEEQVRRLRLRLSSL